jgi:hypothetical protein
MLKKVLLIATATAFFVAVGVPETSFGPASCFRSHEMWRGDEEKLARQVRQNESRKDEDGREDNEEEKLQEAATEQGKGRLVIRRLWVSEGTARANDSRRVLGRPLAVGDRVGGHERRHCENDAKPEADGSHLTHVASCYHRSCRRQR